MYDISMLIPAVRESLLLQFAAYVVEVLENLYGKNEEARQYVTQLKEAEEKGIAFEYDFYYSEKCRKSIMEILI